MSLRGLLVSAESDADLGRIKLSAHNLAVYAQEELEIRVICSSMSFSCVVEYPLECSMVCIHAGGCLKVRVVEVGL